MRFSLANMLHVSVALVAEMETPEKGPSIHEAWLLREISAQPVMQAEQTAKYPRARSKSARRPLATGTFLLRNAGLFYFDFNRVWPIFLIALGVWLLAQKWGLMGSSGDRCYCDRCRTRSLMGPAVLVTIGVLSLLESVSRFGWHRTWPILILVIGTVKLLHSNASGAGHIPPGSANPQEPPTIEATDQAPQPPANEVKNV